MKFHIFAFFAVLILLSSSLTASAQVDSVIGQVTSTTSEAYAGGISGDGRFIVFESTGDHATERIDNQPNNADGNREIFLFDYAQRRIFQITNTRSLLTDPTKAPTSDNIKVDIVNIRPVISNDGRWIAFGSNATCTYPGNPTATPPIEPIASATNPGNFNPNATTGNPCLRGTAPNQTNNLVNDGNTEMWLYAVPAIAPVADLSAGDEVPLTNLAGGAFTQVTNTRPSRLPVAGSTTVFPVIADDNHDASIDDTGAAISFTSNRDLCPIGQTAPCGNAVPNDNDEIYAYVRGSGVLTPVTVTPRGTLARPIYSANSTITNLSAGGWRIAFISRGNNPIPGMTNGGNTDNNEEIFFADLDAPGALANRRQVTTTTQTNTGDVVNILNYGRRMSRDGRFIAFDSFADLKGEHGGANQPGFATFVYDTTVTTGPATNAFNRVLPRSNADSGAAGGDIQRYPGFTDYDANRTPLTLVMETRMNIRGSDGTIPTNPEEGLNNVAARPAQLYSASPVFIPTPEPGDPPPPVRSFKRITKLPVPSFVLASIQPIPSNSLERMTFNLSQTETGSGNTDLAQEVYYFLLPEALPGDTAASFNFSTGASRIAISPSPVPTPSPTATPSPSPSPSPTPQQPAAVQGASPGMLAILDYNSGINTPVVARTAVGSLDRRFTLPIELSGVTLTVNGAAAGIQSVGLRQIVFVVPPGLAASAAGTEYPVVVNNNGVILRGKIVLVPARPDIFTNLPTPGPGGRARVLNVTNRVYTREPFTIRTFRLRGSRLVPSVLRVYLTGVNNFPTSNVTQSSIVIRIGNTQLSGASILTGATLVSPGVYSIDFQLPPEIAGAGDQPIVVNVTIGGVTYSSRLDDTASRIFIL